MLFSSVLTAGGRLAWPAADGLQKGLFWTFVLVMIAGALLIFKYFTSHMRTLVDFAATVAFVSAPLFAYLNVRVISHGNLPSEAAPPRWLYVLSWAGLVFLTCFSVLFLVVHFGVSR